MSDRSLRAGRLIGGALWLATMGLILVGMVLREPSLADYRFWLVRWPVWMVIGLGVPLVALRVGLWHRRRARRQAALPAATHSPDA